MTRSRIRTLGFAALLVLAATLPFELEAPWLRLGPVVLTNVEVVLGAVLALALLAGPAPNSASVPRSWRLLALWFVLALALAAWLAPEFRANAFKATLRTVQGLLLVPALLWLAPTSRHGRMVILALVGGGVTAALIGLAEQLAGHDFAWLAILRPMPTYAGPFLRLSGPLDYANQASMYLEVVLPFLFALTIEAMRARRRLWTAAGALALVLAAQATILTFSRAGFATLMIVSTFVAAKLFMRKGGDRRAGLEWSALATLMVALVVANWLLSPAFRLRLQSDVDTQWYRSRIEAPTELALRANELRQLSVTVVNEGALTWEPEGTNPFRLGLRWQEVATGNELTERRLWSLPGPVPPGESLTLTIPLRAPSQSGDYRLIWDMVHVNVNWFDARGDTQTLTQVAVTSSNPEDDPAGDRLDTATAPPMQFDAPLPGRRVLWTIAARLIRQHPLTGIGLDNFRLTYSQYLADDPLPGTALDQTVHSNNWYLETAASVGVIGTLPFLIWLTLIVWSIIRTLHHPNASPLLLATGASLLAFIVHGLLDYFLLFNATALLFWMTASLLLVFNYDSYRV